MSIELQNNNHISKNKCLYLNLYLIENGYDIPRLIYKKHYTFKSVYFKYQPIITHILNLDCDGETIITYNQNKIERDYKFNYITAKFK